jgi:methionyl aminopeptidase
MYTKVKNAREIQGMRQSGRILAQIFEEIREYVEPGCSGKDVSQLVRNEIKALGAKPVLLGYEGYPDVICISPNDVIVHGIPNGTPFKEGDLVGFDLCVGYDGMITDSAFTMAVGKPANDLIKRFLSTTKSSLDEGIAQVKDGVKIGDIAAAIQKVLDKAGYGIVRDLVGHGVGHYVHEDPNIPNYGQAGKGDTLHAGMTIAIEPMATLGDYRVTVDADDWAIRTKDGSLSAHFEHTVLITSEGGEVLTTL